MASAAAAMGSVTWEGRMTQLSTSGRAHVRGFCVGDDVANPVDHAHAAHLGLVDRAAAEPGVLVSSWKVGAEVRVLVLHLRAEIEQALPEGRGRHGCPD